MIHSLAHIGFLLLISCMLTITCVGQDLKRVKVDELKSMYLKDNDTTYVVNFWATWCVPCVHELPHFEKLNELPKVKVILASLDFPKMIDSKLIPFIKRNKLKSEVVLLNEPDENEMIPKISSEWSGAIPATLVINNNRGIHNFHEGKLSYEELLKLIAN
ncbi:MAG: redoxin domain-containing protein [Flavobacteriales bacterium]|nr:redoxin domain-containing protein [Flavobacteriales bacterium]